MHGKAKATNRSRADSKLTRTLQEYIKTIHILEKEKGSAAVTDIADSLGVKAPSVTSALKRLHDLGMAKYHPYRSVTLTKKGQKIGEHLERVHNILKDFFMFIGIEEEIASIDACEIEHIAHPETIDRVTKFVEFIQTAPKKPKWLNHFEEFAATGNRPDDCNC
ncbi:MAG: metal-dependent transcriptional regulator [Candidatus Thorarchaeota archaeon]